MGNKMCGRRRPVEERLTRPQRISRQPSDVDYKKLRKLILSEKLAPCFDAAESPDYLSAADLEECPICFFYYPSLNRSRCCAKGICTECFLQMKPSRITRSAQCPFCKTPCYAVEYRGARTEEERDLERAEEQKVIEAKKRMQSESQTEERVMNVDEHQSFVELPSPLSVAEGPSSGLGEGDTVQAECSEVQESIEVVVTSDPNTCSARHEELDVDLEEIMVMEAIWRSLQDSRLQQSESSGTGGQSDENSHGAPSQPSGHQGERFSFRLLAEGVATAIATLAKNNNLQQPVFEAVRTEDHICEVDSDEPETEFSSSSGLGAVEHPCMLATELNA